MPAHRPPASRSLQPSATVTNHSSDIFPFRILNWRRLKPNLPPLGILHRELILPRLPIQLKQEEKTDTSGDDAKENGEE